MSPTGTETDASTDEADSAETGVRRLDAGRSPLEMRLAEIAEPVVVELGFELVRVRITGGDNKNVQIMAEKPDRTMTVDSCADISRALSQRFDEVDPISSEYTLEISSPGIARPLTRPNDFEDFKGHVIKAELAEAMDGRKRFRGVLDGMEDGHVMIAVEGDKDENGQEMVWGLPFEEIAEARLVMTDELAAAPVPSRTEAEETKAKETDSELE